jgi:chorismate synthase
MRSNVLGENFRILTFGESHGPAVGVVIDGVVPGIPLDASVVQADLDRRRPGTSDLVSSRREPDRAEILSGIFEGRTTGAPVCILVRNMDVRSGDYEPLKDVFRPGHGDFTWLARYGIRDWRGGGRLSGRETVGRVAGGAVARRILEGNGIRIRAHVVEIGSIRAGTCDPAFAEKDPLRCGDPEASERMAARIRQAAEAGDSVGGVVEVRVEGVPAGLGDPVFMKLDAELARALVSVGGVKGVEFGDGFACVRMTGSEHNDPMVPGGFLSNHAGGILGGISTGQDLVFRVAVKPTSSIRKAQDTVDTQGRARVVEVRGRHDPCLCPRIVPVAEAMTACVLADAWMRRRAGLGPAADKADLCLAMDRADDDILHAIARRVALAREVGTVDGGGLAWRQRGQEYGLDARFLDRLLELISPDVPASRTRARRSGSTGGQKR